MSVSWYSIPLDKTEREVIDKVATALDLPPKVFMKRAALSYADKVIAAADKKREAILKSKGDNNDSKERPTDTPNNDETEYGDRHSEEASAATSDTSAPPAKMP